MKDGSNRSVSTLDYAVWYSEYINGCSITNLAGCGPDSDHDGNVMDANFNYPGTNYIKTDNVIDIFDYAVWIQGFVSQNGSTPTTTPVATVTTGPGTPTRTPTPPAAATKTPVPQPTGPVPTMGASSGIWLSQTEIKAIPIKGEAGCNADCGAAWDRLSAAAKGSWGTANLGDNNSKHDTFTVAGAIYAVRMDDPTIKAKTITAIEQAPQSSLARVLEMSRGLQSYVIAADMLGYHSSTFDPWVRKMLTEPLAGHDCDTLVGTAECAANNWGGHARASAIAAALYLHDDALLNQLVEAQKEFIGMPNTNHKMGFDATTWHAGSPKAGENVLGAKVGTQDVSGVLPEDWRRNDAGCSYNFTWPPPTCDYMWEGMQGYVVSAVMLHRANKLPFSSGDNAVKRAMDALYNINNPAGNDDTWIPWVVNKYAGTHYPTGQASPGKNMGWTDWTHQ